MTYRTTKYHIRFPFYDACRRCASELVIMKSPLKIPRSPGKDIKKGRGACSCCQNAIISKIQSRFKCHRTSFPCWLAALDLFSESCSWSLRLIPCNQIKKKIRTRLKKINCKFFISFTLFFPLISTYLFSFV